jgi:hypothetical protein
MSPSIRYQQIEKVTSFDKPQDVFVLNKILEELNRRSANIPSGSDLAIIKYLTAEPTPDDIPQGTLGIWDPGVGSPKRFYFKTNLNILAYIETGYFDAELGVWIAPP